MVRAWLPLSLLSATAAMQVSEVHEHVNYDGMKNEMLSMAKRVGETGKIDAGTVAAINGFLAIIKDNLYPAIDTDRSTAQASLDAANAVITQCGTDRTTWKDTTLDGFNTDVSTADSNHNSCRRQEQVTLDNYTGHCQTLENRVCSWTQCNPPSVGFAQGDSDPVFDYICCLDTFFDAHRADYYTELKNCHDSTATHHAQTALCDGKQATFQDEFCAREAAIQAKCDWYDDCRCAAETEFEAIKADVEKLEDIFQHQWVALNQLSCYGEQMLINITDLSGCDSLSNDCEADHAHNTDGSSPIAGCPVIVYPTPDPFIPCTEPHGSYPCQADWVSEFYGWLATEQPCTPYDDCDADMCGNADVAANKWGANDGARHSTYAACSNVDTGVRIATCVESVGGNSYFLGNSNLELGITPYGDFGTRCPAPSDWYSARMDGIGMSSSYHGFGSGSPVIGIFLPGSPEERFALAYKSGSASGALTGGSNSLRQSKNGVTVSSLTSNGLNTVTMTGKVGVLEIEIEYNLFPGDKHFTTTVNLRNDGADTIYDARYHRSFDPDNTVDAGGAYTTNNVIVSSVHDGADITVVAATSDAGDSFETATGVRSTVFMTTDDVRCKAYIGGFSNDYDYSYNTAEAWNSPQATGYSHYGDVAIQLTFGAGDLAPGATATFRYQTVMQYLTNEADIPSCAADTWAGSKVFR